MMFLTCPQWHSLRVLVALAVVPAFAQVYHAPPPPQHHVEAPQSNTVFVDNFTMWTGNSQLLSSLASEFSSAFVPSQLNFSSSGLQMTGPTQDFQLAGLQSLSTFTAPCTVASRVISRMTDSVNWAAFWLIRTADDPFVAEWALFTRLP